MAIDNGEEGGSQAIWAMPKYMGDFFLLHLQWQSVSSHRVLKLTQQFGGIGGAIGYPLLSSCQCPPGGRALLMKPLQQPIARDCLLHRWLCISSVLCSSMIFPPITNTSIHQPHRHSHLKSIGVHYQGAEDTSLLKIFPWSPTYIEQDFPLPSQLSHWDKDQSFFISSSRHYQPPKPLASAYNEVTTGWSLYI